MRGAVTVDVSDRARVVLASMDAELCEAVRDALAGEAPASARERAAAAVEAVAAAHEALVRSHVDLLREVLAPHGAAAFDLYPSPDEEVLSLLGVRDVYGADLRLPEDVEDEAVEVAESIPLAVLGAARRFASGWEERACRLTFAIPVANAELAAV